MSKKNIRVTIDAGIPLPVKRGNPEDRRAFIEAAGLLKPGESFFVPFYAGCDGDDRARYRSSILSYIRKKHGRDGRIFVSKREGDGFRLWRAE